MQRQLEFRMCTTCDTPVPHGMFFRGDERVSSGFASKEDARQMLELWGVTEPLSSLEESPLPERFSPENLPDWVVPVVVVEVLIRRRRGMFSWMFN